MVITISFRVCATHTPISPQPAHKLLLVNDDTQMFGLAYNPLIIASHDREVEPSPFPLGQSSLCRDSLSKRCRFNVRGRYLRSDSTLTLTEQRLRTYHGSILHQGYHHRSSKYRQITATHTTSEMTLLYYYFAEMCNIFHSNNMLFRARQDDTRAYVRPRYCSR